MEFLVNEVKLERIPQLFLFGCQIFNELDPSKRRHSVSLNRHREGGIDHVFRACPGEVKLVCDQLQARIRRLEKSQQKSETSSFHRIAHLSKPKH